MHHNLQRLEDQQETYHFRSEQYCSTRSKPHGNLCQVGPSQYIKAEENIFKTATIYFSAALIISLQGFALENISYTKFFF